MNFNIDDDLSDVETIGDYENILNTVNNWIKKHNKCNKILEKNKLRQ